MKSALLLFELVVISTYFIGMDMWQYILGSFMPIMGLKVKNIPKTWRLFVILIKRKHVFLHSTTNTCYNSVRPDFIHPPGCVIDVNISLSMVKWV